MALYNKVIKDQKKTESWMEKEDYDFLERVKALGDAMLKQTITHPGQLAPAFFNEYKSFGDLREAYKNKTIGKEYINNELNKMSAAWDILPDGGKRFVLDTLQAGSDLVGGTWEQIKTVEGAEKYDPTAWMTSWLAHGIDFAGDKLDKYVAKPTAGFVHNQLGIDKRGADLTGLAAEMLLTRRAFKAVPQTINLINKGVASKQAHSLAFKAGQWTDEALGSFKPANKRVVRVTAESIIDDVLAKSPTDIRAIVKVAKTNKISLSKAEDWINLSRRGIKPKQSINPGTNNKDTKLRVSPDPLDKTDLSYASIDDIRNAELALIAKGIVAPTTEDLYNYLSEYKTDHTIVPKKDWYNPKFKKTSEGDLFLYAKDPKDFKRFNTLKEAHAEATADLLITRAAGKRWSGIEAEIGNPVYGEPTEFVKLYAKGASKDVLVLPYNKWFQQTKDPFRVPKDVANKLRKMEEGRQIELIDDVPPTYIEKVKKGKSIRRKAEIKLPKGTVDKWIRYVKDEIAWQTSQQRLDEKFAKELYKKHGIPYTRGKTVFSRDKSHAVPRSEGGPGYTFLEAWWSNQQRGRKPILSEDLLDDLGVPRTWEEYFWRWYQQEELGEAVGDFGKLENIKWDDYERAMNGVSIDQIRHDRKTINHLIQRQIEDPTTFNQPGTIGATIGEDFELLVKKTKSLPVDDELLGEINPKEFDLRWRAANFEHAENAKPNWLKTKARQKYDDSRNRWVKKQLEDAKKKSKKSRIESRKQGQSDFDKDIQNLQLEQALEKEIGVKLISEKELRDILNTIFP